MEDKVIKKEAEWKKELITEEYYMLTEKGTERGFINEYWNNHEKGNYHRKGCKLELSAQILNSKQEAVGQASMNL